MIRGILSLAVGGGIAFGAATYTPPNTSPNEVLVEDETPVSVAKNKWTLSRAGKIVCNLERTQKLSEISYQVVGNGDCAKSIPGLADAHRWQETASGVDLLDTQGKPILQFATAEFDGMQSYFPAYPILTLEPQH